MRILRLLPAPVVLLAACAGLRGRTPPPASLTVIVRGEGEDTLRAQGPVFPRPVPTFHRLPSADGSLGYEGLSTATGADSGLVLLLNESAVGSMVRLMGLQVNPLESGGLPSAGSDTLRIRAGEPCESVVPFLFPGAVPVPRGRAYVAIRQRAGDLLVSVDPRRDALRARPVLHFRTDTLRVRGRAGRRWVAATTAPEDTGVLVVAVGTTPGRPASVIAWAGGGPMSFQIAANPAAADAWSFYLIDDRPRLRSPCRGRLEARPRWSATTYHREQAERAAAALDSTLAVAGVRPLAAVRLRGNDRELRVTTGGGMIYQIEHVLRVWVRRGRAGGEIFEYWRQLSGSQYAGGPWGAAKQPPAQRGCRQPHLADSMWVCRIEPLEPVDWQRVAARLDSLEAWTLPPQPGVERPSATDMGDITVAAGVGSSRSVAYYYGPQAQQNPESRRAEGIAEVLDRVVRGGFLRPAVRIAHPIELTAALSVPTPGVFWVRDATSWQRLAARFPRAGKSPPADESAKPKPAMPHIDFENWQLLVLGNGWDKTCAVLPWYGLRVEQRGRVQYAVLFPSREKWTGSLRCESNPAPVRVYAIPRERGSSPRLVTSALMPIREVVPPGATP